MQCSHWRGQFVSLQTAGKSLQQVILSEHIKSPTKLARSFWAVGRMIVPQRHPSPNSQHLWTCYRTGQKGTSKMGWQLRTWVGETILHHPGGFNLIIRILPILVRGSVHRRVLREIRRRWLWRWQKGAMSRGMNKDMDFPLEPPAVQSCQHLDFSSVRSLSDLFPVEL